MGIGKIFLSSVFLITGIVVFIVFFPGLPPDIPVELRSFHIAPPKEEYLKLLESNNILDEAELYYESQFNGFESIVELDDGSIVAGDQSGTVYRITGKQRAVNITQLKYPCISSFLGGGGKQGTNQCGWPLGIRKDLDGNVLLMDYFGGMTKVDIKTGLYKNLLSKNSLVIDNLVGHVFEDLDVAKDGTIYWTDGSTIGDFITEIAGQPSGRLIKYDRAKNVNEVLLGELYFSNGICLSEDEEFVLVAEMGSASIRRYYLKGKNKGKNDVFVEGLPGYPDNIRPNGRGGFYVALFCVWNEEYSMRSHILSPYPLLRKFILRVRHILLAVTNQIKQILPDSNVYLYDFEQYVTELRPILRIHQRPKTALIAELSKNGKVVNIFQGTSGKIPNLSQVTVGKTYAYMTCPFDNKIWRIKLDKLRSS